MHKVLPEDESESLGQMGKIVNNLYYVSAITFCHFKAEIKVYPTSNSDEKMWGQTIRKIGNAAEVCLLVFIMMMDGMDYSFDTSSNFLGSCPRLYMIRWFTCQFLKYYKSKKT